MDTRGKGPKNVEYSIKTASSQVSLSPPSSYVVLDPQSYPEDGDTSHCYPTKVGGVGLQ